MKHPDESRLALFAGGDLGFWEARRVRGHLTDCAHCAAEVSALRGALDALGSLPEKGLDCNWERLSQEMTGNIRVGFAAGECVAGFERHVREAKPRLFRHAALVMSGLSAVVCVALWLNMPQAQMDHLTSALGRIGRGRAVAASPANDPVVLETGPTAIQVKTSERFLSIAHPEGATVSINVQDSAGVRYVDADSGQVTLARVYYGQ